MKIITTSDWHLGNLFHGNDRLPEHRHFLSWLLSQLKEQQPDALLVAGDVFDNGNPSAAAQSAYYEFLAEAAKSCPKMMTIITAGNHDSANRLEAPRALMVLNRMEVRGTVRRKWVPTDEGGSWEVNYDDLIIPLTCADGSQAAILAVPYLRSDMLQGTDYSKGMNLFLRQLTDRARTLHPDHTLVMMAHIYAKGSDIATKDASEKILIGGQEEVNMEGWEGHPDYLTCGHIHKRQHVWGTDWARYSGSVLPMSFAEKDYHHGVDMVTFSPEGKPQVQLLEYQPQHTLCILNEEEAALTPLKLSKLIEKELDERVDGALGDDFKYVVLKVNLDKVNNDELKQLEALINSKNAVLCKIQKIVPQLELTTLTGHQSITSVDDILNRDPLETLQEAFVVKHKKEMSERQKAILTDMLNEINTNPTE